MSPHPDLNLLDTENWNSEVIMIVKYLKHYESYWRELFKS